MRGASVWRNSQPVLACSSRRDGGAGDPIRLHRIDVVARGQVGDGVLADVLGMDASEQVVQEPFAQRPVGNGHALDPQGGEDGGQDRHTAGEHRSPLDVERL